MQSTCTMPKADWEWDTLVSGMRSCGVSETPSTCVRQGTGEVKHTTRCRVCDLYTARDVQGTGCSELDRRAHQSDTFV